MSTQTLLFAPKLRQINGIAAATGIVAIAGPEAEKGRPVTEVWTSRNEWASPFQVLRGHRRSVTALAIPQKSSAADSTYSLCTASQDKIIVWTLDADSSSPKRKQRTHLSDGAVISDSHAQSVTSATFSSCGCYLVVVLTSSQVHVYGKSGADFDGQQSPWSFIACHTSAAAISAVDFLCVPTPNLWCTAIVVATVDGSLVVCGVPLDQTHELGHPRDCVKLAEHNCDRAGLTSVRCHATFQQTNSIANAKNSHAVVVAGTDCGRVLFARLRFEDSTYSFVDHHETFEVGRAVVTNFAPSLKLEHVDCEADSDSEDSLGGDLPAWAAEASNDHGKPVDVKASCKVQHISLNSGHIVMAVAVTLTDNALLFLVECPSEYDPTQQEANSTAATFVAPSTTGTQDQSLVHQLYCSLLNGHGQFGSRTNTVIAPLISSLHTQLVPGKEDSMATILAWLGADACIHGEQFLEAGTFSAHQHASGGVVQTTGRPTQPSTIDFGEWTTTVAKTVVQVQATDRPGAALVDDRAAQRGYHRNADVTRPSGSESSSSTSRHDVESQRNAEPRYGLEPRHDDGHEEFLSQDTANDAAKFVLVPGIQTGSDEYAAAVFPESPAPEGSVLYLKKLSPRRQLEKKRAAAAAAKKTRGNRKGSHVQNKPVVFHHSRIKSSGYGKPVAFLKGGPMPKKKRGTKVQKEKRQGSVLAKALSRKYPLDCRLLSSFQPQHALPPPGAHGAAIKMCVYSPCGSFLSTTSVDQTSRILRLPIQRHRGSGHTLLGHKALVRSISWSTDSKYTLTAGDDRKVCLWSLERGGSDPLFSLGHLEGLPPSATNGASSTPQNRKVIGYMPRHRRVSTAPSKLGNGSPRTSSRADIQYTPFPNDVKKAMFIYSDQFIALCTGNSLCLYSYGAQQFRSKNELDNLRRRSMCRLARRWRDTETQSILSIAANNGVLSPMLLTANSNRSVTVWDLAVERPCLRIPRSHSRAVHHITLPQVCACITIMSKVFVRLHEHEYVFD